MKRKIFLLCLTLLCSRATMAQLDKGTWLVGGNGSFLTSKNTFTSPTFSSTSDRIDLKISPEVGYFIVEKMGIGLRSSFSKYKEEYSTPGGLTSNVNRFESGPFIKYYFLTIKNNYNVLMDISYQAGIYRSKPSKGTISTFSASAGPVIYFNSSVGLQLLLGYFQRIEKVDGNYDAKQTGFQTTIGFQIHLAK